METRVAHNWYWWLWLSPLLTVPTLGVLWLILSYGLSIGHVLIDSALGSHEVAAQRIDGAAAVLGSALWHLLLLIPALDRKSPFVRWHGRQALLLAGVRTALPLGVVLTYIDPLWNHPFMAPEPLLFIPVQIALWLAGTLLGQRQAARGECSLMCWFGQREPLVPLERAEPEDQAAAMDPDALVEIIRHSRDPGVRQAALRELEQKGMVEDL